MTYLQINSLALKNIRCFDHIRVNFDKGANIITGPNGTGKSTILTGIGYGLFGSQYISINIAELIKRGEESGRIELQFTTERGKFRSIHYLNVGKSNSWKVYRVGMDTPMAETITESQEYIQKLLGQNIDYNVFKNAVASEQGKITGIIDLQPAKRREQIRKILGLDYFDISGNHLGKFSREIESKQTELQNQINALNEAREDPEELENQVNNYENLLVQHRERLPVIQKEKEEVSSELDRLQSLKNTIGIKSSSLQKNQGELNTILTQINDEEEDVNLLLKELKEEQTSIEGIERRNKLEQQELDKLRDEYEKITLNLQKYDDYEKRIDENNRTLDLRRERLRKVQESYDNLTEVHTSHEVNKELEELTTQLKYGEEQQESLQKQKRDLLETLSKLQDEEKSIQRRMNEFKEEVYNEFTTSITELPALSAVNQENITKLETTISKLDEKISDMKADQSKMSQQHDITMQTIDLLTQADATVTCPTCHRDFENMDTAMLIEHHQTAADTHLTAIEKKSEQIEEQIARRELFEQKLDEFREKENRISVLIAQSKTHADWESSLEKTTKERHRTGQRIEQLNQKLEELEALDLNSMLQHKIELKSILEQFDNLQNEMNTIQEVIKVKEKEKNELIEKIEVIDNEALANRHQSLKNTIATKTKSLELRRDLLLPKMRSVASLADRRERVEHEIEALISSLKQLDRAFDEGALTQKKERVEKIVEQLGALQNEIDNLAQKLLPELKERLEKAKNNETRVIELSREYQDLAEMDPLVKRVRDIIESVPTRIIDKISTNLSVRLTQTIQRLLPNRGYSRVVFHPTGEINLYNNGHIVQNSTLSGGERTVLGLAFRLALADYVAPLQFLILDEPTNHLDRERVREFVEIVDRENIFQSSTGQLLLVTHRQEFDRNAENSIRLIVENGVRKLVDQ